MPCRDFGGEGIVSGMEMASKKRASQSRRKPKQVTVCTTSLTTMIAQNLANMATVFASSGSVLLCLLIARRF
ncbi:hypothetical protein SR870_15750 [Rhodopseudomonas palustris]|uniref:hypothetical protein n=1 Tax=Rhodopseudomonas palustris TaxID=1076 RepID=UPI002ACE7D67|nr:hypothetical protein [Rhodopseudomonas palustris]WQG98151.1 hypothetical protein SR870_15750 [Rhodopseudomonas palustris]